MKRELDEQSTATIQSVAEAVQGVGGRALIVGGAVRDRLLDRPIRDVDVEVLGLDLDALEVVLRAFGRPIRVGRSFASIRMPGLDVDFTVPGNPEFDFAEAALRRDLTLNSMALDPLTDQILDPHGGQRDLEQGILRATDPLRFGEDPLRALRAARLVAELTMRPTPDLVTLCAQQDLSRVAGERIFEEFRKLLIGAVFPSEALRFLEEASLLRFFPELEALVGVPQDPHWHPEGDVWVHTLMVVDAAAGLRTGSDEDLALMFGALCHDLGKPDTTSVRAKKIRAFGHNRKGAAISTGFLGGMRAPNQLIENVAALVEHHLAPAQFVQNGAGPAGYRRLARRLQGAGLSIRQLEQLARADHLGRSTEDARAGNFPAGGHFLVQAATYGVDRDALPDVVLGRHLIAKGIEPGPRLGKLLDRCRDLQDETGESDPEKILARIL